MATWESSVPAKEVTEPLERIAKALERIAAVMEARSRPAHPGLSKFTHVGPGDPEF